MSIYSDHLNVFLKMSNVLPFTLPFAWPRPFFFFLVVHPKTQILFLGYINGYIFNKYPQSWV